MAPRLRIGSRGSQLALWQARHVAARLGADIEVITTSGDRIAQAPLALFGGKGLFTKEIEEALLAGQIDLAVHSLKDVPAELPAGLVLAAFLPREDARDALIAPPGTTLASLPAGARVGTSSLRRKAQLLAHRPDLRACDLRGNVDTRLSKWAQGECDALVLAAAGLLRLGRQETIAEYLPVETMCPAAGQGILALECRAQDRAALAAAAALNDEASAMAASAERAVLHALGAGCQTPIGVHASAAAGELRLRAVLAEPDGSRVLRAEAASARGPAAAAALGEAVAAQLERQGARVLLARLEGLPASAPEAP
ncbi:MAG TPA: hydroxymethylbilane synthase [Terriglobales bacterium]|nr:hydroxymethylbilane synthase [Terriglobales bacterium]